MMPVDVYVLKYEVEDDALMMSVVVSALQFVRWDEIELTVATGFSAAFLDFLLKTTNNMFLTTVFNLVSRCHQKLR